MAGSSQQLLRLLAELADLGVLAESDKAILSDGCLQGEVLRTNDPFWMEHFMANCEGNQQKNGGNMWECISDSKFMRSRVFVGHVVPIPPPLTLEYLGGGKARNF